MEECDCEVVEGQLTLSYENKDVHVGFVASDYGHPCSSCGWLCLRAFQGIAVKASPNRMRKALALTEGPRMVDPERVLRSMGGVSRMWA